MTPAEPKGAARDTAWSCWPGYLSSLPGPPLPVRASSLALQPLTCPLHASYVNINSDPSCPLIFTIIVLDCIDTRLGSNTI